MHAREVGDMRRTYATREVSAVLALDGDVLCAGEGAVEDWG
jgi:hypothetical protein